MRWLQASNRLRESKAKSKVIILVTDGVNNRGEIQPVDAAKIAQALGVKIYTVGVGSSGTARFPVNDPVYGKVYADLKVEIDEESLKQIAASQEDYITGRRTGLLWKEYLKISGGWKRLK